MLLSVASPSMSGIDSSSVGGSLAAMLLLCCLASCRCWLPVLGLLLDRNLFAGVSHGACWLASFSARRRSRDAILSHSILTMSSVVGCGGCFGRASATCGSGALAAVGVVASPACWHGTCSSGSASGTALVVAAAAATFCPDMSRSCGCCCVDVVHGTCFSGSACRIAVAGAAAATAICARCGFGVLLAWSCVRPGAVALGGRDVFVTCPVCCG